ncbi:MAG: response regulator [Bryobacteraceae bacterium]|nr:response regulator [Bryobacteraceae bacterium]
MSTILIAEDRDASRELLRTVLVAEGYHVVEAADGKQALVQANASPPDLFLLDLQMPELDGFGLAQTLRQDSRFAHTPIIALTASAMRGDREKALAHGFSAYLTKPIRLPALREEVRKWLPR